MMNYGEVCGLWRSVARGAPEEGVGVDELPDEGGQLLFLRENRGRGGEALWCPEPGRRERREWVLDVKLLHEVVDVGILQQHGQC